MAEKKKTPRFRVSFVRKENAKTGSGTTFDEIVEAETESVAILKATMIAEGKYPDKVIQFRGCKPSQ